MDSAPLKSALRVLHHVGGKTVFEKNSISAVGLNLMAKAQVKSGLEGFAVDTTRLASVVSHLGDQVSLSFGESLEIKSGRSKYTLATEPLPIQKFPELPAENFQLPTKSFQEIFRAAASVAESSNLYDYSGSVRIIAKPDGELTASGTDSKRLVISSVKMDMLASARIGAAKEILIPALAASAIASLTATDTLRVSTGESSLFFEGGEIVVGVKKLAKVFPDVSRPFNELRRNRIVKVDSATMQKTLKQITPMAEDDRVKLTFSADEMKVETYGNIAGNAEDFFKIETVKPDVLFGEDVPSLEVKTNSRHLADFLAIVKGVVSIEIQDSFSPILLSYGNHKLLVAAMR